MKTELQVSGMNCGSCELLVKEALEEVEGVREAEASHLKGSVIIDYEPQKVSIASLAAAIEEQGFKVKA
ncbi:MAG: cation transporter [Chlorobium sp.]|nr:cation transporter [Chlorobium sp.]